MWYVNCETQIELNSVIAECLENNWHYEIRKLTTICGKTVTRIEVTEQ